MEDGRWQTRQRGRARHSVRAVQNSALRTPHSALMKITFGTGGSPLVLVDSPANIVYRNLRINGQGVNQEETLYNAASRAQFYRGNEGTVLTVDTTWQPSTDIPHAEQSALQWRAQIAAIGKSDIVLSDNSGSSLYTLYLHAATVPEVNIQVAGCTIHVSYRILGPAITTT